MLCGLLLLFVVMFVFGCGWYPFVVDCLRLLVAFVILYGVWVCV